MALTLDKPYLGLRASLSGDAVVFVPREGICDGIVLDTPYIGLRAATSGDAVVFLISDQQLEADGSLTIGKPYIGLRAAADGDELVYLVNGQQCNEEGGDVVLCDDECVATGGLCLTVEGTAFSPDPAVSQIAFEGDFPLYEVPWDSIAAEVDYNVYCIDTTDPENPVTVSDDWYTGAGSLLGDYSSLRWFRTAWQTKTDGMYVGPGATDTAPVEWRHVIAIEETACTFSVYTFYRLNGGHTVVRDWCGTSEVGPSLSIFFYEDTVENETGFCTTVTNIVTQTSVAGECNTPSFSCDPFLYEQDIDGAFPGGGLLWDSGASDFLSINSANWSLYGCGA